MDNTIGQLIGSEKLSRFVFFAVSNLLMLAMVGRGMILLSAGAVAGYLMVPTGTLGVLVLTWYQCNNTVLVKDWSKSWFFSFFIGWFALSSFHRMISPYF
jgi:hypothetical protein